MVRKVITNEICGGSSGYVKTALGHASAAATATAVEFSTAKVALHFSIPYAEIAVIAVRASDSIDSWAPVCALATEFSYLDEAFCS